MTQVLNKNIGELLTIVIPVRFRQCTLPRALEYYKDFPGRVIVADASPEPYKDINKWPHAEYHFSPNTPWMQIMVEVLETVDTKYVVKPCDDDFIVLSSLEPSIRFLEENQDYVTVCGQEVALFDTHLGYETMEYIMESKHLDSYSDSPSERVRHMWTYFFCKIHSVARTEAQLEVYKKMVDYPDLFAIRFFDKVWGYMMAAMGNFKVLPILSHVRSQEKLTLATSKNRGLVDYEPIEKEIKANLSFAKDFLNRDLTPLLEMVDEEKEFIEEIHQHLCDEKKKLVEYDKLLEKYDLLCEEISPASNGGITVKCEHIGQKVLAPRFGPAASNDYIAKFRPTKYNREEAFPVYKEENLNELRKIVDVVTKFPLEPWG